MRTVNRPRRGILSFELALILPLLVIALLALVEIATYLMANQSIEAAAMLGAREASLPNTSADRVQAAVTGALATWSYGNLPGGAITIADGPVAGSVSVSVAVDADKAALNPLANVTGFDLKGKKIAAQFILRKE